MLTGAFSCTTDSIDRSIPLNSLDTGQKKDSLSEATPSSDFIKYGMSFGECSGYCITENTYQELQITSVRKAWRDTVNYPPKITTYRISKTDWNKYYESLDFNAFSKLPKVTGCPDCTDGGAGWIELSKSGNTHKVTFDLQNPPTELESLIKQLDKSIPENL